MGARMTCFYCNSKDTTSAIYLYRYNDNNTFVIKNSDEVKYSCIKRKPKRLNYDGTLITYHNHNKYCNNCHKIFNSGRNLYAVDISKITLIFMLAKQDISMNLYLMIIQHLYSKRIIN